MPTSGVTSLGSDKEEIHENFYSKSYYSILCIITYVKQINDYSDNIFETEIQEKNMY